MKTNKKQNHEGTPIKNKLKRTTQTHKNTPKHKNQKRNQKHIQQTQKHKHAKQLTTHIQNTTHTNKLSGYRVISRTALCYHTRLCYQPAGLTDNTQNTCYQAAQLTDNTQNTCSQPARQADHTARCDNTRQGAITHLTIFRARPDSKKKTKSK